jgi:hypothetical protein
VNVVKTKATAQAKKGKGGFFPPFRGGETSLTISRKTAAIKLLVPDITIGCQGSSLMNNPLVLQKNAAKSTASCPAVRLSFGTIEFIPY